MSVQVNCIYCLFHLFSLWCSSLSCDRSLLSLNSSTCMNEFLPLLIISHLKNLRFSATQTKLMMLLWIFQLCGWLCHNLCQPFVYFFICSVLTSPALLSLLRSCHYSSAGFLRPSPPLQFIPSLVPQYADICTSPGSFTPHQTTLVLPPCPSSDLFVLCPGLLDVSKLNYLLHCLLLCCAFGFCTNQSPRDVTDWDVQYIHRNATETNLMNQHILITTNTFANCQRLLSQHLYQRSQHHSYQHVPNLHRTPVVWLGFG